MKATLQDRINNSNSNLSLEPIIEISREDFQDETIKSCKKALIGAIFNCSQLINLKFINVSLLVSNFDSCMIKQCQFKHTQFDESKFKKIIIKDCIFEDTTFIYSLSNHCVFENCQFTDVNFFDVVSKQTCFKKCAFRKTRWDCALFYSCQFLESTDFEDNYYESGTLINSKFSESKYKAIEFKGEIFFMTIFEILKSIEPSKEEDED
jgi:uncharacterized protein YjbI with pentapeptide repeats